MSPGNSDQNLPGGLSDAAPEPIELVAPGKLVAGRFLVISELGRGGVGAVYSVENVLIKKQFALKILNPIAMTATSLRRFQQEAKALSRLEHPNLVRAIDFGILDDGQQPYMLMELVSGKTLAQYLKEVTRMSIEDATEVFLPLLRALQYAHELGVIHRDIKPGNIMLVEDAQTKRLQPKLLDFGIAKFVETEYAEAITRTGEIFGTPAYMSPEQCDGAAVDRTSDIYSLGCVFYEMLTGAPPFTGATTLATMMQHKEAKPLSLKEASLGAQFPANIEQICQRMLIKDPKQRIQSCAAVEEVLLNGPVAPVQLKKVSPSIKLIGAFAAVALLFSLIVFNGQRFFPSRSVSTGTTGSIAIPRESSGVSEAQTGSSELLKDFASTDQPTADRKASDQIREEERSDARIFKFPATSSIGELYWWQNSKLTERAAVGEVTVPNDALEIFEPDQSIYQHPNLLAGVPTFGYLFHFTKLSEFSSSSENLTRCFKLVDINEPKFLKMNGTIELDSANWSIVAGMKNLIWFAAMNANFDKYLNQFGFLKNLEILELQWTKQVTPSRELSKVLHKLSAVKRLAILKYHFLSVEDCKTLSNLRHLKLLNIDDSVMDGPTERDDCLIALSASTSIETLVLNTEYLEGHGAGIAALNKMRSLKLIVIRNGPEQLPFIAKLRTMIKNCKIEESNEYEYGFDSKKENPVSILGHTVLGHN